MNSDQNSRNYPLQNGCGVWSKLHSEREDTCEALLNDSPGPTVEDCLTQSWSCDEESCHRELLQTRLRQLDEALDRIMAGTFGECSNCGRWIEDTRLAADPTTSLCIDCQQRGAHHLTDAGGAPFIIH